MSTLSVQNILDLLEADSLPDLPKPRFVVPDNMAEALQEAWGTAAEVIPVSETRLPLTDNSKEN